jgi:hypothetical protein
MGTPLFLPTPHDGRPEASFQGMLGTPGDKCP